MKKARFILTALVLLAGIGGALAFKASRFTAAPVQVSTDFTTIRVAGLTYSAIAGIGGAPTLLCQPDFLAYWNPFGGVTLNAFSTLPATTTIPFSATTTTVGGGTTTITVTRAIHTCISTTGLATFSI